jgi:hypothetical protein
MEVAIPKRMYAEEIRSKERSSVKRRHVGKQAVPAQSKGVPSMVDNLPEQDGGRANAQDSAWSCAVMTDSRLAFGCSTTAKDPRLVDICGFCGRRFDNCLGWVPKLDHLTVDHHVGRCTSDAAIHRGTHFRQHLEDTHAAQIGAWTSILEAMCLYQEVRCATAPVNKQADVGQGRSQSTKTLN